MKSEFAHRLPADWGRFARVFSALGDGYRQRILLFFEAGERLTIKQVADALPLSRTAVVHHVGALRAAGILEATKEGRDVYLTINKALLVEALSNTLKYAKEAL